MKYIVYIIFIAVIASFSFFYSPTSSPDADQSYAVRIDGRSISSTEIAELKQHSPSLFDQSGDLPESLIMREILIAEALRQKVDQEEAFHHRIKTFYEQSLVKILVDRKMASIHYTPTTEEVAAYKDLLGRKIELDLVPVGSPDQSIVAEPEHLSAPYLDLSAAIRMEILFLKPGVASPPFQLFGQNYVIIVQHIGEKDSLFDHYDDARDLAVITEYRRQQIFTQWQESLMEQAKIEVAPKQKEQES